MTGCNDNGTGELQGLARCQGPEGGVETGQGDQTLGGYLWRYAEGVTQIRLEGWSFKYDSIYCLHSENVAPPRTHTEGYTTQDPFPLRELPDEEQLSQTQSLKVKLNLLLSSDLTRMNPTEISLFFRVELFTAFDSILTLPFNVQHPPLSTTRSKNHSI